LCTETSFFKKDNMQPQTVQLIAVVSVLCAFALAEILQRRFFAPEASAQDNRLDIAVTLMFPLIGGAVLATADALCTWLMPEHRNVLASWPVWQMVLVLLLADDMTQYFWHRLSHTSFMWPLHRAHHSAAYMSVRIVYRNNAFYYALMPGLWLSGVLIFLGFGWVYVAYSIVKLTVIIGAHSAVRWDQWLYRYPKLSPLAWVVERTIQPPPPTTLTTRWCRTTASVITRETTATCCFCGMFCLVRRTSHGATHPPTA
jgi:sterol desaturase/sphingolipid hydroxylase (fatty acid hydroxylase superfamily)